MIEPMVSPCCGCGYCCQSATCMLGVLTFGFGHKECPALMLEDGRFWCRIVKEATGLYRERLEEDLAIGAGCSSTLFNSQREACREGRLLEFLHKPSPSW